MKPIYVIGSGGFAKEVYFLVKEINKSQNEKLSFKGFIDKESGTIKLDQKEYPIIKEDVFLSDPPKDACIAIGIGNPSIIEKVVLKFKKLNFPNLIHPNFIGDLDNITIGEGNIITAGCIFTVDIKIGSFNIFNLNCTVGHDTTIKNGNVINPGCNISGGVEIGNYNLFGTNSTILQYIKIDSNSVLGAAGLLTKDLESKKLAVGMPAKVIKEL